MFQYKILDNNLYHLNKQLFIFNKRYIKLCYWCRLQNETTNHIFVECKFAIEIWSDLKGFRSSHPEVFCKKGVLSNFAKFTGKHLCQSLFLNEVAGLRPRTSGRLLLFGETRLLIVLLFLCLEYFLIKIRLLVIHITDGF